MVEPGWHEHDVRAEPITGQPGDGLEDIEPQVRRILDEYDGEERVRRLLDLIALAVLEEALTSDFSPDLMRRRSEAKVKLAAKAASYIIPKPSGQD